MFDQLAKLRPKIEYKFWASPGHEGQTLAQLAERMAAVGNAVLVVDTANNRLLVGRADVTVWGCRLCYNEGLITLTDTEGELNAHAKEVHGWTG